MLPGFCGYITDVTEWMRMVWLRSCPRLKAIHDGVTKCGIKRLT